MTRNDFAPTLVTGCGGQLGHELCRLLGDEAIGTDIDTLDITDRKAVQAFVSKHTPKTVINAAAYTAVDQAEDQPDLCHAVNSLAVKNLAEATKANGSLLIQISTDYVFTGCQSEHPFVENDNPIPVSIYAKSKRDGETHAQLNPNHLVIRTCGLYGQPGPTASGNFVTTMLRLGQQRDSISVVDDQACTPTSIEELAAAIVFLVKSNHRGLFHITNDGWTTWKDFASAIFEISGLPCKVQSITTEEFGAKAARPRYSVLDCSKYRATNGPQMSNWKSALRNYLDKLQV